MNGTNSLPFPGCGCGCRHKVHALPALDDAGILILCTGHCHFSIAMVQTLTIVLELVLARLPLKRHMA
jgi:hypothetical protein